MKRFIILFAITGLVILAYSVSALAEDGAFKIVAKSGKVLVKTAATKEWVEAAKDQTLAKSDLVKTEADSTVVLELPDKSSVTLKPKTEITIEELVWTNAAKKVGINMSIGELRTIVQKVDTPSEFVVKTPTAISGARGTVFYVMFDGTNTRIFVTEGSVDFSNANGENTVVVITDMSAIASGDGSVSTPRELTGEERDQALAGWLGGVIAELYTPPEGGNNTGENLNPPGSTPEGTSSRT